jgi:hypothetical protein
MKTAKQQSRSFRRAIHAEKAREAYIAARRGGEPDDTDYRAHVAYMSLPAWDTSCDSHSFLDPEEAYLDLSARAPVPSADGWQGLGA